MSRNVLRQSALLLAAVTMISIAALSQPRAAEPKAFVVNEIQVTDATKYQDYVKQVPATLAPFGGVFVTRGGAVDVLDGAPPAGRVVILEFPSRAQAKAWHDSPAYQKILAIRNASSTSRVYIVEGIAP